LMDFCPVPGKATAPDTWKAAAVAERSSRN
jgi:hypothetical protein